MDRSYKQTTLHAYAVCTRYYLIYILILVQLCKLFKSIHDSFVITD